MPTRNYIKEFAATHRAPYLGMPPGMVLCDDVADLPSDVRSVWLNRKTKHIDDLPRFREIRRVHSPLHEEWLPAFASMPNLEHVKLTLPKCKDIPSLACLKNLRTLVLGWNRQQESLEFVRGMDWLHSLCVSEAMGVTSLEPLSTLPELREIYIDGQISARYQVESLNPLSALKELQFAVLLVRLPKERRNLLPLKQLKKLEYLWLSDDYYPSEYDALLDALPQLKEICFNGGKRWPAPK
ncbi:hypothetical protein Psta_0439 [Pirellula staleyi DSM 6068]|uniref:Leucine-rich repeat domain-containing protein n=1 Tax=Pirellula staleyi (strain ATCC 27377 / DSM 6068 / ICPB 4128) TaxID=530564 RepID=D2R397_PIRSD|nr:leucine-rich repeat domain-containing protein [Pirellula staleyi]ADB15128.1 hypothetical protein Psta_0439 [Pirellula staleyi DSM 6068]